MVKLSFLLATLLFRLNDHGAKMAQVTFTCGEDGQIEMPFSSSNTGIKTTLFLLDLLYWGCIMEAFAMS